jgi:hypothetical protein
MVIASRPKQERPRGGIHRRTLLIATVCAHASEKMGGASKPRRRAPRSHADGGARQAAATKLPARSNGEPGRTPGGHLVRRPGERRTELGIDGSSNAGPATWRRERRFSQRRPATTRSRPRKRLSSGLGARAKSLSWSDGGAAGSTGEPCGESAGGPGGGSEGLEPPGPSPPEPGPATDRDGPECCTKADVGVSVGVAVGVVVGVSVGVAVGVVVGVSVGVGDAVAVGVVVGVSVGVAVDVIVGVLVGVAVDVIVAVPVAVGVGVVRGVRVAVAVAVGRFGVADGVGVAVFLGVAVAVAVLVGLRVGT